MIAWAEVRPRVARFTVSKRPMPARGYALGCGLGVVFWLGIGAGLWWLFL